MAGFLAALLRLCRPQPHPMLLPAILAQVHRQRTVHQLHQLRSLAASWLAAPQLRQLDQHLQRRMLALAANLSLQPSPKSTSSRTRRAKLTGKRRR